MFLKKAGAHVVAAGNGEVGVQAVNCQNPDEPFDIVLMDMQMPVMDGYTATRQLRDQGCVVPIIALTAHAMAGDREKCLRAGCTSYLSKPVQREELVELIECLINDAMPQLVANDGFKFPPGL